MLIKRGNVESIRVLPDFPNQDDEEMRKRMKQAEEELKNKKTAEK